MTTVPSINSAALLILQQTGPIQTSQQQAAGSDDLLAVANGMSKQVSSDQQPTRAQAKVSESLFSVNHVSINKLKMDLIDRTGKALGVDQADYASRKDFVDAMQKALGKLKMEGGDDAVRGLEKELGLDKLGVSIQDVIDSAKDPEANDKLTKALEKQAKINLGLDEVASQRFPIQFDEAGTYGLQSF
ncbi:hypothetical protein QWE_19923 [Agrobacterium albertimagni AOL15]|uniref:Uncharacterized protein n=2 Tax=Agrobacterium albertimagni TaxID=147266 RepID=K2PA71_9HYPH|nr:hypothetical protein [Agrobacterium albertimagni]EKF57798.1 hypothetical protein QWE_19923 [Agrobacterium albertimagni AOL15]